MWLLVHTLPPYVWFCLFCFTEEIQMLDTESAFQPFAIAGDCESFLWNSHHMRFTLSKTSRLGKLLSLASLCHKYCKCINTSSKQQSVYICTFLSFTTSKCVSVRMQRRKKYHSHPPIAMNVAQGTHMSGRSRRLQGYVY